MKKEYVKIIVFAVQSVITAAVIVLACIFGIPCEHKDTEWVVTEATCEEWGERQLVCQRSRCGAVLESKRLEPVGHKYAVTTNKKPTCTENGLEERTCKLCGDVKSKTINKKGHNEEPAVIENYVDPTCTKDGGYNEVVYCSTCKAKVKSTKVVVDALGHTEKEPVAENYLNANCTFNGSYDAVVYCSTCDEELDRQPTVIHAPGHDIVAVLHGETMKYSCADCGFVSNGSEGISYILNDDDTLTVVGIGTCTDEYIFIPAYIGGKKVVAIGDSAFENTAIKYIGIAPTVEVIGNRAFAGCAVLDKVVLPNIVTTIGDSAFYGCRALKRIVLPDGITEISDYLFYGCVALESVVIPEGVERIGESAFHNTALESVVIPDNVTIIGNSAFNGCIFLSEITLSKSITVIGDSTFFGCKSLESIELPEELISIGKQAFSNCESLMNIVVPGKVTTIGEYAFSGCTVLERIFLPYTLTSLGLEAFHLCTGLTLVEFDGTDLQWEKLSVDLGYNYGGYVVTFGTVEYQK